MKLDKNIKEHLLQNIVNAAIRAGAAIMEIYNSNEECDIAIKSDNTPITNADRAAHSSIKETLGATRIPILSEEGREMLYEERQNWEMFWLVDPLDGTVEFINRNNEFTVNIALMHNGKAILGVIYIPCLNRLYFAATGYGAYLCKGISPDATADLNYNEICSGATKLPLPKTPQEQIIVAISRSHITPDTLSHIETLRNRYPNIKVIEQGSSYKFCLLAEDSVDYYIRTTTTFEWDTAAGELILTEAGGKTQSIEEDKSNSTLKYNKKELQNPWFKCYSPSERIE